MPISSIKTVLLFSLFSFLLFASGSVLADCAEETCVHQKEIKEGQYELHVENLTPIAQKVRLKIKGENIEAVPGNTVDFIVQGFETLFAAKVGQKDRNKAWSYGYEYQSRHAEGSARDCFYEETCLNIIFDNNDFEFSIENRKAAPIVVKIEDEGIKNLNASRPFPVSKTYPANATTLAFTASLIDEWSHWSHPYKIKYKVGTLNPKHQNTYLYRLPYETGDAFFVSQDFLGPNSHKNIYAIDWTMPEGTPVHAARDGTVIEVVDHHTEGGTEEKHKKTENHIYILHSDGTIGAYVHLKQRGSVVSEGDEIKVGQKIGYSGNTGYSTGPHLHFEVYGLDKDLEVVTIPVKFLTRSGSNLKEHQRYVAIDAPRSGTKTFRD